MAEIIKIKKGLDIPLPGRADPAESVDVRPVRVGIVPADFPGYTWKLLVKVGDKVGIGTPLMQAKEREGLMLVSPAKGEVAEVRRGERRRILALVVDCAMDGLETEKFTVADTTSGMAVLSLGGEKVNTVSATINYLRAGKDTEKLVIEADVVKCGRTLAVVDAKVMDDKGELLVTTTMTFMIFRS